MRKKKNPDEKQRTCLKCGKKFRSFGPGNRICDKCARLNQTVSRVAQQSKVHDMRE